MITVTERVPVLIWQQDGRSILVDAEGMTFQARDEAAWERLPVIEAAGDPPPVPGDEQVDEAGEAHCQKKIQAA